jgi:hypothetical protein
MVTGRRDNNKDEGKRGMTDGILGSTPPHGWHNTIGIVQYNNEIMEYRHRWWYTKNGEDGSEYVEAP